MPEQLRAALDTELAHVSPRRLAAAVTALSDRYRTSAGGAVMLHSPEDTIAYAAFRLPATFAAAQAVLHEVRRREESWAPRTLLDIGAGPGTVMWAAATVWPDLGQATLIERDERMIALGKRLAAKSLSPDRREARWISADLTALGEDVAPADLVTASYVLGELPPDGRLRLLRRLWDLTAPRGGTLVIIEPGTPARFALIKEARDRLLAAGARTVAPCPHDWPCPMPAADWCHFSRRVARSRLHRQVKAGELSYEDEKFAYLAVSRQPAGDSAADAAPSALAPARVLRHPQVRPGHIRLELCTPAGLESRVVTRGKDGDLYKHARGVRWGETMPPGSQ